MKTFIEKYAVIVVILAIIILIWRGEFFSSSPLVILGQLAAVVLAVSGRIAFRKQQISVTAHPSDGPLVRSGPYRFIRHPMYAGVLLLIWVSILGHLSLVGILIGLIVLTNIVLRVEAEESLLKSRYSEYADYMRQTKKLVPFLY